MKTTLNENGLITQQASGPSTLNIKANSIEAETIYQGNQNISKLLSSLTEKVNSVFDRVLTLSNEISSIKAELKESATNFATYKEVEKLEQKFEKELKNLEKTSKVQSKTVATKEVTKEESVTKQ